MDTYEDKINSMLDALFVRVGKLDGLDERLERVEKALAISSLCCLCILIGMYVGSR